MACRRPSRPRVPHGTRLAGSPLTVGAVHTPAAAAPIASSYFVVPASMPRIARPQTAWVPTPTAETSSAVAGQPPEHFRPGQHPATDRAEQTRRPPFRGGDSRERQHDPHTGGQPPHRTRSSRIGGLLRCVLPLPQTLEDDRGHQTDGYRDRETGDPAAGPDPLVQRSRSPPARRPAGRLRCRSPPTEARPDGPGCAPETRCRGTGTARPIRNRPGSRRCRAERSPPVDVAVDQAAGTAAPWPAPLRRCRSRPGSTTETR